jgi:hypothetical protein
MTVLLVAFLFEYLPKLYHSARFLRRMRNVSGYIFGTIWWGIALNHYYLDQKIWRIRGDERLKKNLGLA